MRRTTGKGKGTVFPPHPCRVPEVPRQVHGGIEEALAGRPPCVWRDIRKIPEPLHIEEAHHPVPEPAGLQGLPFTAERQDRA